MANYVFFNMLFTQKKEKVMDQKCIRGLRYLLLDSQKEIEEYTEAFRKGFAYVSRYVFDNYPNLKSYNFKFRIDGSTKDLKQTILDAVNPYLKSIGIETYGRCVVLAVLSNYQSFRKRNRRLKRKQNGFPSRPIQLTNGKAIRFDDQCIQDKNGKLSIPGLNSNRIEIKYVHPGTVSKHKINFDTSKNFGGTLAQSKNGQWRFTAKYDRPIIYQYKQTAWIGSDFNETGKKFVVLSDGQEFPRSQECIDLEEELTRVNDTLRDPKTIKNKRRYYNNKRKELHKKHRKLIRIIGNQVINYVLKNQHGLAIDDVGGGQTTGSWGQDKLVPYLIERCQTLGIPYYVSDPAYTSQTCSQCGYRHKNNRKKTEEFICQLCGYKSCAHFNGATNAANAAIAAN